MSTTVGESNSRVLPFTSRRMPYTTGGASLSSRSFRQNVTYGEYPVRVYKKYLLKGLPKKTLRDGISSWVKLVQQWRMLTTESRAAGSSVRTRRGAAQGRRHAAGSRALSRSAWNRGAPRGVSAGRDKPCAVYRKSTAQDQSGLRMRMRDIALSRPRFGLSTDPHHVVDMPNEVGERSWEQPNL